MTDPHPLSSVLDTPMILGDAPPQRRVRPLQTVAIETQDSSRLVVTDGRGRVYADASASGRVEFRVAGAAGWHRVRLLDAAGGEVASYRFEVACVTQIDDGDAGFGRLLGDLHFTMLTSAGGSGLGAARLGGKTYRYFIRWLRDHTHALKGMKYFSDELRTGLELYADTQREDGMLFERIAMRASVQGWRDHTFAKGDFIRTLEPGAEVGYSLQRIPVENDVEYLFIECLYRTWQATGDTGWMARYLDHAERAVAYATSDHYRWSEKFRLLKRGFTIDTWDFLHTDDARLTLGENVCDPDATTFGVMHGDNTGMARSCRMLAEMLEVVGHGDRAPRYRRLADDLLDRLAATAWDDRGYYRHHVSEDPAFARDVGDTDESTQVSLSNAYALNRDIGPDKARAILKTYRRIRDEMPAGSPGEFYTLYPPFEKGFDKTCATWHYVNGGVSTLVAGELARGAFAHGMPAYGADILQRVRGLTQRYDGRLHVCFHGNPRLSPPERGFTPIDLGEAATVTAAYRPAGPEGVGWGEEGNDLSRMPIGDATFHGVPFRIDPRARCVGVADRKPGYLPEARVQVGARHRSLYFLHAASQPATPAAELILEYEDGTHARTYLSPQQQLDSWFMPGAKEMTHLKPPRRTRTGWPAYRLAWRGANARFDNVGLFMWSWDNPEPDKPIRELVIRAAHNGGAYLLAAITASDHPVWFPPSEVSHGIPDSWGAAAVVYALIEGLAGVVDGSYAFERVELTPSWQAASVDTVDVQVAYPASGGYVAYRYRRDPDTGELDLIVALSGDRAELTLPRPEATTRGADWTLSINGRNTPWPRGEPGLAVVLEGPGPHHVKTSRA